MNSLMEAGARLMARTSRLFTPPYAAEAGRDTAWEMAFLCAEAPICAEAVRHSIEHGKV